MEFTWRLLLLHDPKKGELTQYSSPASFLPSPSLPTDTPNTIRPSEITPRRTHSKQTSLNTRKKERIPLPVRIYVFAALLGVLLAILAYLHFGQQEIRFLLP
jgi:hypothetical protein